MLATPPSLLANQENKDIANYRSPIINLLFTTQKYE